MEERVREREMKRLRLTNVWLNNRFLFHLLHKILRMRTEEEMERERGRRRQGGMKGG